MHYLCFAIEFTRTFSRLWESCRDRKSIVDSRSLFGLPTNSMGTLTAFISNLTASAGTFMASTTLTRTTLILKGPYKHFHASATVSRSLMTLWQAIQALPLSLQALLWFYITVHYKIYIFTVHMVQKHFLKAFKVLESVYKVHGSACTCRGS